MTNDVLCCLKGFIYLLSKSSFSTFYYSLRNIFSSCGKDVQCKQSLHNIHALNLRFLLRKRSKTSFTVWLLLKTNSAFHYQDSTSGFILEVRREILYHVVTANKYLLAFTWPPQYLTFQKQFAHAFCKSKEAWNDLSLAS